ncbi:prephenate dehydrogenase/arogenate dehydrogenase family protein [Candidatus Woesebacteria bacterium]|nr:prephenate dehydrogenase/arogenate dehydrogenase family protein [Candidatus Woesebacteria bacterium]
MISSIGIIGTGKLGAVLKDILPQIFPEAEIRVASRKGTIRIIDIASSDLIIPAVPTAVFKDVIQELSQHISPKSTVMDVCAVKKYPVTCMKQFLPQGVGIIASHPMFGPGTLRKTNGLLKGLKWVIHPVRDPSDRRSSIVQGVVQCGIEAIDMTPDAHDRYAASFHFTAHVVAQILKKIELSPSPINTRSVESLFEFMEMVQSDSVALLQEMIRYNPYCKAQFQEIIKAETEINTLLLQS